MIGSGTGQRGGGRVWLRAERIGVFGRILANGEDSVYYGAGGSGGTIILNASNMTIDRKFSFPVFHFQRTHLSLQLAVWEILFSSTIIPALYIDMEEVVEVVFSCAISNWSVETTMPLSPTEDLRMEVFVA